MLNYLACTYQCQECVFISRRRYFVCAHVFVHIDLFVNVHADASGYFFDFQRKMSAHRLM